MSTRIRITKVDTQAIEAGYSRGWHLFIDDEYVNTFALKREARETGERLTKDSRV